MADDDFKQYERNTADERREQNLSDHNDATAGRFDTGRRINRGMRLRHDQETQHKKDKDSQLSQALKINAEYAKLYNQVMNDLGEAENTVYDALIAAGPAVSETEQALSETIDNATSMPDGTRVFRDKDGNAITEDGRKLHDDEAAGIEWRKDAPSWEDYQARKQAHERARERFKHLERDNDRLAVIRARMEDEDNPPNQDELEGFKWEIEKIKNDASNTFDSEAQVEPVEAAKPAEITASLNKYGLT